MTTYMHCRPCSGSHLSTCPCSFLLLHPDYIITANYTTYSSSSHDHNQVVPPPVAPRRRRRLEDPVITHASNYYATLPLQSSVPQRSSQSPPPPPPPPPLPPPRRTYQQVNRQGDYCDLFNLLERPSSPSPSFVIKPRRKFNSTHDHARRHHRLIDLENLPTKKVKSTNDHTCNHHRHQSSYHRDKDHQTNALFATERYDRSSEKTTKTNNIYPRRSPNKGFFRRVVCNYFCMPSSIAHSGYSS